MEKPETHEEIRNRVNLALHNTACQTLLEEVALQITPCAQDLRSSHLGPRASGLERHVGPLGKHRRQARGHKLRAVVHRDDHRHAGRVAARHQMLRCYGTLGHGGRHASRHASRPGSLRGAARWRGARGLGTVRRRRHGAAGPTAKIGHLLRRHELNVFEPQQLSKLKTENCKRINCIRTSKGCTIPLCVHRLHCTICFASSVLCTIHKKGASLP